MVMKEIHLLIVKTVTAVRCCPLLLYKLKYDFESFFQQADFNKLTDDDFPEHEEEAQQC